MTKAERVAAITAIEQLRGSRVLTYLTADRGIASTPISADVMRIAYDHLVAMGHVKQIDLFIYSRGGDAMLPWPLVNTIREFCDRFCVLVPFRAYSAATLIALGADEIVMTPLGQLTPVEPTITMPLNPPDPANPGRPLGINVEDVAAYMEFVAERAGADNEAGRIAALEALTAHVNPVALGHLHRFHKLARQQAQKLLELHMEPGQNEEIGAIVEAVIRELWAHDYKINRAEARGLGLKIKQEPTEDEENAIWRLFEGYESAMSLRKPILPGAGSFAPGQPRATLSNVKMAYVESSANTDVFSFDIELNRPLAPTTPGQPQQFGPQVQVTITRQEWRKA